MPGSSPATVLSRATTTVYVTPFEPFVGVRFNWVTCPDVLTFNAEMLTVETFPTRTAATSDSGICAMICCRPPTISISGTDPDWDDPEEPCDVGYAGKSEKPDDDVAGTEAVGW